MTKKAILWFRRDLRLRDNPALCKAVRENYEILPVYIQDTRLENQENADRPGGASRLFGRYALENLAAALKEKGGLLILKSGDPQEILQNLIQETGAEAVFWNRLYTPAETERDKEIKQILKTNGVHAESFKANLLFEPHEVMNGSGTFYKVYSPYRRACEKIGFHSLPADLPENIVFTQDAVETKNIDNLYPAPTAPDWSGGIREFWGTAPDAADILVSDLIKDKLESYKEARNFPAQDATSRLSPYLAWGVISPLEILDRVLAAPESKGKEHYISELLWREFSAHLLFHAPEMVTANFRPEFNVFPWRDDPAALQKWKKGQTGVPIVDAGMRQLWQTGWMHNRVRMIVGSFLVKHLLIDWREGEAWFRDTLVDYDLANNVASWQWVAGCGADAAPYFRVFNPILQAKKFDQEGEYIRKYVPELKDLPAPHIFEPWAAPSAILHFAKVKIGETYPAPIMEIDKGRDRALQAFDAIKTGNGD